MATPKEILEEEIRKLNVAIAGLETQLKETADEDQNTSLRDLLIAKQETLIAKQETLIAKQETMTALINSQQGSATTQAVDQKVVSFERPEEYKVRVTHWQRSVIKNIPFNERSTFKEFCIRVKLKFSEEIDDERNPPAFRIYILPAGYKDVADRRLVDNDKKFEELRDILMNASVSHPVIYVWNYDKESPAKLPNVAQAEADTGSVISRDSTASKHCKTRDDNTCLCCGYVGRDGFGLKACHIYEIGAHKRVREEEARLEKLGYLQLVSINDLGNLITLCEKCHPKFDSHKLGIHPAEHTWIVTNVLREGGATAQSNVLFVDIHAKKVPFATRYIPPTVVLDERMSHFLPKNSPNRYCHFCLYVCTDESVLDDHIQVCGATALLKSFSGLGI